MKYKEVKTIKKPIQSYFLGLTILIGSTISLTFYSRYRRVSLTLLLLFYTPFLFATNYYVSNAGNDAATGKSPSSAWKTIAKVNTSQAVFLPGDSILLQRGSVFYESMLFTKAGTAAQRIYVGAYGTGNNPVLDAGKTLTGWVSKGTNLWEVSCPDCPSYVNALTVNNALVPMGRYPDDTNLYPDAIGSATSFSDADLSSLADFTGGEVIIRTQHWIFDRWTINSKTCSTLSYAQPASAYYFASTSTYYFLQNHLSFLNRDKEWAYDSVAKKVYIYLAANPSTYDIRVTARDEPLKVNGANYTKFENLTLAMANNLALNGYGFYQLYKNIKIDKSGKNGLLLDGANTTFSNCQMLNVQNNMAGIGGPNMLLADNLFQDNSLWPGMGQGGENAYYGVVLYGQSQTFLRNRIDRCGFLGVNFADGNNMLIKNNYISSVCLTKDDGAANYTYGTSTNTNRRIVGPFLIPI